MSNYLPIAKIVRPHGLKGEVKVRPLVDEDVNMTEFKKVYLGKANIPSQVLSVKPLNGFFSIGLDTLSSIDEAEKYRNQFILVDRADYPQLFGQLRASDIIGYELKSEEGELLGNVVAYNDYGASTILTIGFGGMNYQIPMVEEIVWLSGDKTHLVTNKEKYLAVRI